LATIILASFDYKGTSAVSLETIVSIGLPSEHVALVKSQPAGTVSDIP
jgi:hypothetical protein